jgi:hypothetical protein
VLAIEMQEVETLLLHKTEQNFVTQQEYFQLSILKRLIIRAGLMCPLFFIIACKKILMG